MKFLVVLSCLLAVACAKPGVVSPFAYGAYGAVAPSGFSYGYSSHVVAPAVAHSAVVGPVAHSAVVGPVAHSSVVAPAVHSAVVGPVAHSSVVAPAVHSAVVSPVAHSYGVAPVAHSYGVAPAVHAYGVAPAVHAYGVAPVVHSAAVVGVEKSQYHAQDELGQAAYGHAEAFQTHNAVQDAAGNKIGSYSYVAPNGQVVAADYVADALGYRVASNAVPIDTPEVVAARAAHLHEVAVTRHRSRRSPGFAAYPVAAVHSAHVGYGYAHAPVVAHSAYVAHNGYVAAPHAYARYY